MIKAIKAAIAILTIATLVATGEAARPPQLTTRTEATVVEVIL